MITRLSATVNATTSTTAAPHEAVIVIAGESPISERPWKVATRGIVTVTPPANAAAALRSAAMSTSPVEIRNEWMTINATPALVVTEL